MIKCRLQPTDNTLFCRLEPTNFLKSVGRNRHIRLIFRNYIISLQVFISDSYLTIRLKIMDYLLQGGLQWNQFVLDNIQYQ